MYSLCRAVLIRVALVSLITALLLARPDSLAAQATSGLTGVVTDASGAVVVGADVKLENPDTAFSAATDGPTARENINSCMWLHRQIIG